MVKTTEGKSFADLFKKIKSGAGDKLDGIRTVRKSRGGYLVIEMEKEANCTEFTRIVRETLGQENSIRRLVPRVTFEFRDIDPTLEREELQQELAKKVGLQANESHSIEVKIMRFGFQGTRTAIVALPAATADELGEEGKIRIGYTACRYN